jgi:hypothetical protein
MGVYNISGSRAKNSHQRKPQAVHLARQSQEYLEAFDADAIRIVECVEGRLQASLP